MYSYSLYEENQRIKKLLAELEVWVDQTENNVCENRYKREAFKQDAEEIREIIVKWRERL